MNLINMIQELSFLRNQLKHGNRGPLSNDEINHIEELVNCGRVNRRVLIELLNLSTIRRGGNIEQKN